MLQSGRSIRVASALTVSAAAFALAGCVTDDTVARRATPHRTAVAGAPAAPKHHAHEAVNYSAVGLASWYGADFHGRRTAGGDTFDMHSLTAAHRTLPLQCTVRVTNLANHRSLLVRINDRGPFIGNRLIDLSAQSAKRLGFYDRGVAKVKVDYVAPAQRAAAPPRITAAATPPL